MSTKTAFRDNGPKYWTVTSNSREERYTSTHVHGVVALSLEEVIDKMKTKYPDRLVVSINHVGPVDLL